MTRERALTGVGPFNFKHLSLGQNGEEGREGGCAENGRSVNRTLSRLCAALQRLLSA